MKCIHLIIFRACRHQNFVYNIGTTDVIIIFKSLYMLAWQLRGNYDWLIETLTQMCNGFLCQFPPIRVTRWLAIASNLTELNKNWQLFWDANQRAANNYMNYRTCCTSIALTKPLRTLTFCSKSICKSILNIDGYEF